MDTDTTPNEANELAQVIDAALDPVMQRMDGFQAKLDNMREEGRRPDDDPVLDIEEQLKEVRAEFAEQVRLLQVQGIMPGAAPQQRNEELVYAGALFRDVDKIREGFRQHGDLLTAINQRAFDTTDLATAGVLTPRQANAFIDSVIAEMDTLSRIQTLRMGGPTRLIEELLLGGRKIRAAVEDTAPAELAGVTSRKRTLTAVEIILAEDITLNALEDNIEAGGLEAHIVRILSTVLGNDMNDLAWNGDESFTSTDTDLQNFISINEGFLGIMGADASVNDYNATGDTTAVEVLNSTLKTMPSKYRRGGLSHNFFVPIEFADGYLNDLSNRATALGDTVLQSGLPAVPYFGILLIAEAALSAASANLVLTPAANLVHGIHRDIRIEGEWRPRKRSIEYTLTARNDYELADPNAVVLTSNIPAGLLT